MHHLGYNETWVRLLSEEWPSPVLSTDVPEMLKRANIDDERRVRNASLVLEKFMLHTHGT